MSITYASDVEYIAYYAKQIPETTAVIAAGKRTSYRQLWKLVCGFAQYLRQEAELKKGEIVLIKASQTLEYVVAYFGTHLAGGALAPVEGTASIDGFDKMVWEFAPRLIIVNPQDMEQCTNRWDVCCISNVQVCQLAEEFGGVFAEHISFPQGSDLAVVMFTTGTTGTSKGVMHTQRSMIATVENMVFGAQVKAGTDILTPGPMNHSGPIRKMLMAIVNGSAVVMLNGLKNMPAFFSALESAQSPMGCALVPSAIGVIFAMTGDKIGEYADKIEFIISDSAPLPEINRQRLCRLLPNVRLYCNYGSTEAGSVCMYDYNRFPGKIGCIGKAGPNSPMFTVDDVGNVFKSSPNEPGRLACRGDLTMKGYWNAPELTAEVMRDGLVCTNDMGYIDDEGYVYILGRQGDVINVGGLKVAPTEVEDAALAYPGVAECVCVPVDDRISGKAVKLCVVSKPGEQLDARELRNYLMDHLENFKVPKYIIQVDVIPHTYNGKLDRKKAVACFGAK